MKALVAALLLAFASTVASGQVQAPDVARDPVVEARLKALAEELRCLVCQNQTIADSNAGLAVDLRNQIRTQIGQGRSDEQIRDYMVERYGAFVLYKPPFQATTALLWIGPFALLATGVGIFVLLVRRRRGAPSLPSAPGNAQLAALLEQEPGASTSQSKPSKQERSKRR
jgi:cytochrome c-type biogenesis protein CcmH